MVVRGTSSVSQTGGAAQIGAGAAQIGAGGRTGRGRAGRRAGGGERQELDLRDDADRPGARGGAGGTAAVARRAVQEVVREPAHAGADDAHVPADHSDALADRLDAPADRAAHLGEQRQPERPAGPRPADPPRRAEVGTRRRGGAERAGDAAGRSEPGAGDDRAGDDRPAERRTGKRRRRLHEAGAGGRRGGDTPELLGGDGRRREGGERPQQTGERGDRAAADQDGRTKHRDPSAGQTARASFASPAGAGGRETGAGGRLGRDRRPAPIESTLRARTLNPIPPVAPIFRPRPSPRRREPPRRCRRRRRPLCWGATPPPLPPACPP